MRRKPDVFYNRTKRYDVGTAIAEQYSSLIKVYQMNYVENLFYLLNYTGMTRKAFSKRMSNEHIKNGLLVAYQIQKNQLIGFDIICVAVLAHLFKLPTTIILNYRLSELEGFVPEDYGIYKDMFKGRRKITVRERAAVPTKESTVYKKMIYKTAKAHSDFPSGIFNIWDFTK
jgi:hypothetical protein